MISIRKYEEKDKPYLREICVKTSKLPVETSIQREFLYLLYNFKMERGKYSPLLYNFNNYNRNYISFLMFLQDQ